MDDVQLYYQESRDQTLLQYSLNSEYVKRALITIAYMASLFIVAVVQLSGHAPYGAIYPKRRTSSPGEGHRIYPYLLRSMKVTRPRQVYAADITYIPMAKGFLYLVAVIDWHSRKVLAHRLSNTMDAAFCVEAMEATHTRLEGRTQPVRHTLRGQSAH